MSPFRARYKEYIPEQFCLGLWGYWAPNTIGEINNLGTCGGRSLNPPGLNPERVIAWLGLLRQSATNPRQL
jgi:hypothetical protein